MSVELGQTTTDRGGRHAANGTAATPAAPAMADLDAPLVADADGLRASWLRIQAEFVDDPKEAVADAAALVEHAAQALVGTLQQRQLRLRAIWDETSEQFEETGAPDGTAVADSTAAADDSLTGNAAAGDADTAVDMESVDAPSAADDTLSPDSTRPAAARPAGGALDTEQLRLVLRRYRSLLDQICQPV